MFFIFKVQQTPNFFRQKNLHALVGINRKIFGFGQIFELFCPVEVKKTAAILARDRVSRMKGLATAVTSLREPNSLYFALFRAIHLLCLEG